MNANDRKSGRLTGTAFSHATLVFFFFLCCLRVEEEEEEEEEEKKKKDGLGLLKGFLLPSTTILHTTATTAIR